MKEKIPADGALRRNDGVIDQHKQQIDPAGKDSVDQYETAQRSQKQPGQDLRDPQDGDHDGE